MISSWFDHGFTWGHLGWLGFKWVHFKLILKRKCVMVSSWIDHELIWITLGSLGLSWGHLSWVCACVCIVCVCIWIPFLFAGITVLHCHVSSFLKICRFDNTAHAYQRFTGRLALRTERNQRCMGLMPHWRQLLPRSVCIASFFYFSVLLWNLLPRTCVHKMNTPMALVWAYRNLCTSSQI